MKLNQQTVQKIIFFVIAAYLLSCAKKNDIKPNTVTINGTVYPTVIINGQTWTAQNYSGPGGGEVPATASYGLTNGNYYNAFNITLPPGWRIPNVADFNNLLQNYSGNTDKNDNYEVNLANTNALQSVNGWINIKGTNTSGFNAVPAGVLSGMTLADLNSKGENALFLSTTIYQDNSIYVLIISNGGNSDNGFVYYSNITTIGYEANQAEFYCSIRFVKDN